VRLILSLSLILAALWVALSGHFSPLLLTFGVLSVALVTWLTVRLEILDREAHPIHLLARGCAYWPWLLWQILLSNLAVVRIILDPRLPISPRLIRLRPSQRTDLGRVIYANSITLTPGTVSVRVDEDRIVVHALTAAAAEELRAGEMDRRVARLERER